MRAMLSGLDGFGEICLNLWCLEAFQMSISSYLRLKKPIRNFKCEKTINLHFPKKSRTFGQTSGTDSLTDRAAPAAPAGASESVFDQYLTSRLNFGFFFL
jgi:hypothetical protein